MEILSWEIYEEEPSACSLISQALNRGRQLALRTTELAAVAVLTGAITLTLESAPANQVEVESIKANVRGEFDIFVDEPEFIELFEFVLNLGANKATHIPFVLEFGSNFIAPKKRQLRLQTFVIVNMLPLDTQR